MRHQGLHRQDAFGTGAVAPGKIIEQLGYVQIDTINVIERAHHHIFWSRQGNYRVDALNRLQSEKKKVFEYWTHALAYIPTRDFHHSVGMMKRYRREPGSWFGEVSDKDARSLYRRILKDGPISISDVKDDVPVEKAHPWASRKPSKRVLQYLFYCGILTISRREGMLKYYDCTKRHFGFEQLPGASTEKERLDHLIDRALDAQGIVDVDSIIHLRKSLRSDVHRRLERRAKEGELRVVEDHVGTASWMRADEKLKGRFDEERVHVLSPFDPLVIQRDRFARHFGLDFRFEAYVPAPKRKYGYFACPVLLGDDVQAMIDMKADREKGRLLIQKWSWISRQSSESKRRIEEELGRFEAFQLRRPTKMS